MRISTNKWLPILIGSGAIAIMAILIVFRNGPPSPASSDGDPALEKASQQGCGTLDPTPEANEPLDQAPTVYASRIVGTVSMDLGAPIEDAQVRAIPVSKLYAALQDVEEASRRSDGVTRFREVLARASSEAPAVRSGSDGAYDLRLNAPGRYRLRVEHADYIPDADTELVLAEGEERRVDFSLLRARVISGRVLNEGGQPVSGARITAQTSALGGARGSIRGELLRQSWRDGESRAIPALAASNPAGSFTLLGLRPGIYRLEAAAPGYAPCAMPEIHAGDRNVQITLERGGVLAGKVSSKEPIKEPGASKDIEIFLGDLTAPTFKPFDRIALDDLASSAWRLIPLKNWGPFQVLGLPEGIYEFRVRCEGFRAERGGPWRVMPGTIVDVGTLELEADRPLRGRVIDERGKPIGSAKIRALLAGEGQDRWTLPEPSLIRKAAAEAMSEEDGSFELRGLARGKYDLEAWSQAHIPALEPGVDAPSGGPVEILVRDGRSLRGMVLDGATREPIEGAVVGAAPEKTATTDGRGEFVLRGLPESESIVIVARANGYQNGGEKVMLLPGESAPTIEVALRRAWLLRGIVVGPEGEPVPGAKVRLSIPGMPLERILPSKGEMALTGGDGRFQLEVRHLAPPGGRAFPVLAASHPEYADGFSEPINCSKDPPGDEEFLLALRAGGRLSGRVLDQQGQGLRDAEVWLRFLPAGEPPQNAVIGEMLDLVDRIQSRIAAAGGGFAMDKLAPGRYRLEAEGPGYARSGMEVEVRDGEALTVEVILDRGGAISGQVLDSSGSPVQAAEVIVLPDLVDDLPQQNMNHLLKEASGWRTARSDDGGRFRIEELTVQPWLIIARRPGYAPGSQRRALPGGRAVKVVLKPMFRIGGTVIDASDRQAVPEAWLTLMPAGGSGEDLVPPLPCRSSASGDFAFGAVPAGEYTLRVQAEGFIPRESRVSAASGDVDELMILLARGFDLNGMVTSAADGRPVPGAVIVLLRREEGKDPSSKRSVFVSSARGRADGTFRVPGLEAGEYQAEVTHRNYLSSSSTHTIPGDGRWVSIPLTPAAGLIVEVEDLPMYPIGHPNYPEVFAEGPLGGGGNIRRHRLERIGGPVYSGLSLDAGDYRIQIQSGGYPRLSTGPVSLKASETVRIRYAYERSGGVEASGIPAGN